MAVSETYDITGVNVIQSKVLLLYQSYFSVHFPKKKKKKMKGIICGIQKRNERE
jgi:hypothetical protein